MSIIGLMRKRLETCSDEEAGRVKGMIVNIINEQNERKQEEMEILFHEGFPRSCPETHYMAEVRAGIR